ncbi:MAG: hypothetical protein A2Z92_00015 [Omnitrophica WOR_2 bacterium GWA2_63_20]|nr:MAG: hypothetical protein A2Z92_00015 [Omnitrophica WOR_2 bacterium GWA2_63_20]
MRPWVAALVTVGLDQLTKWIIRSSLAPQQSIPLLPGVLHLTYVRNTGAAFSLFRGQVAPLIVASGLVAGWIGWELLRRPRHAPPPHESLVGGHAGLSLNSLGLILGGAIGNLIDRLRFGYVEDFIDLRVWPVFNVADSAITVGVTLLIWTSLFAARRQATSDKRQVTTNK